MRQEGTRLVIRLIAELGTAVAFLARKRAVFSGDGSSSYYNPVASFDTEPTDVVSVEWNALPTLQVRDCGDAAAIGSWFGGAWEQCLEGKVTGSLPADWRAAVSRRKL